MPEAETSLDVYIQRLDVLCSVVEQALQPGGRATKHDLRLLHSAANKVIDAYLKDRVKKDNEKCGYSQYDNFRPEYVDNTD